MATKIIGRSTVLPFMGCQVHTSRTYCPEPRVLVRQNRTEEPWLSFYCEKHTRERMMRPERAESGRRLAIQNRNVQQKTG